MKNMLIQWGIRAARGHRLISRSLLALCALGAAMPGFAVANATPSPAAMNAARAKAAAMYAGLPMMFEANRGQSDARVKFLARGPGYTLFLTRQEAVLKFAQSTSILRLKFLGASPAARISGHDELRAKTNYLQGNDPKQWHRDVPNYAAARYQALYSGVDAIFHGSRSPGAKRQRLEFDFDLAPGADPTQVALQVEGARGLRLDRQGDVVLRLEGRDGRQEVVLGKPRVYQTIAGRRRAVSGAFALRPDHRLAFVLGPYDHAQRLIIDPSLAYSSYVAGGQVNGVAVDAAGDTYVVGTTSGGLTVYPNPGIPGAPAAYQTTCDACSYIGSAFVAKYDTAQSGAASLIYSTYLGPAGTVYPGLLGSAAGSAIAVDAAGDAYVTGAVQGSAPSPGLPGSSYFPTTANALFTTMPGSNSAFVSVLDPTGETLLASTYLGGDNSGGCGCGGGASSSDQGTGIAVDSAHNVYVTGLTNSPGLATAGAPQTTLQNGSFSGTPFVAKLNSALSTLDYYTYLGGSDNISGFSDTVMAIAVDAAGEAYVVGGTFAGACSYVSCTGSSIAGFPAPQNAGFQPAPGGTNESGYLAKLNAGGTRLLYFTYLGGGAKVGGTSNGTQINAIALDGGGNAYVTGTAGQILLPTPGSVIVPQSSACQSTVNGTTCAGSFVAEISPNISGSSSLVFLTYLGGISSGNADTTVPTGIALNAAADIYVAGSTSTTDMPVPGTVNTANGSLPSSTLPCAGLLPECVSPFLVELAPGATSVLYSGYLAGTGGGGFEQDRVAGVALDSHSNVYLAGSEATNDFPVTTNGYDQIPPTYGSNGYLAVIGGLPSSGGTPSVANYTLNGVGPSGFLVSQFVVSAPATTSLAVPIVVTNTGGTAFSISDVSLSGPASPPWSFTSLTCNGNGTPIALPIASPVSVGQGQSCTILLQFAPTLVQSGQDVDLTVQDNASSSNASSSSTEQVMSLDGTGTAAPPPSYASYSLGTQPIVQANGLVPAVALAADVGGTATAQLVLTNTGGEPFTISGVSLPTSAAPWSITGVNCLGLGAPSASSPAILAPGQICTIGLQFAPTALGISDAALSVLDTATGSNLSAPSGNGQEFLLQGTGGQPNAQYSPVTGSGGIPEINFGNVPENSASTQQVTVTNTGNGPLTITGDNIVVGFRAASTLAYWTLSRDCNTQGGVALFPVTLVTGESCVFTFQLDPSTAGNLVALVSFFDNAAQSNIASTLNGSYIQEVKLYGVGVLPLSGQVSSVTYTPEELNFTNPSGTQNRTVVVTNTGTQPLKITGADTPINTVSRTGGPGAFTLVGQGCTGSSGTLLPFPVTLATDASCTFTFQYNEAVEQQIVGPLGTPASFVGVYATFYTNAYEANIGSSFGNAGPVQYVALLTPNEATAITNCGSSAGLGVSASPVEQGVLGVRGVPGQTVGSYGQTVTVTDSNRTTVGFDWVVLEGLNTGVEEVSGTTPTDTGSVYACGDVGGSPAVLVQMQRGSGTEPLIYPEGIFPSYQYLKLANGSGSP